MAGDEAEQRLEVLLGIADLFNRPALTARREKGGEIELFFGRVQGSEKIEHFVMHLMRARVGTVYLVDDDHGLEANRQSFRHDELGLRQGAFRRVDEQQHAVHHRENTLHFAAEIGVARRINDIDAQIAVQNRCAFGENGNAAFTFQIVAVHRALGHLLVLAESARLLEHGVDQRGFTVIDVGYNGDIT